MQQGVFSSDLIRLVAAAVVSPDFCELLLADPGLAMRVGYEGTPISLTEREREVVCAISAASLADFTKQLIRSNGNGLVSQYGG